MLIDHDQAGVTVAAATVEQDMVGIWPGLAIVRAHLDGHVAAAGLVVGIGEKEQVLTFAGLVADQTRHAGWLGQGTVVAAVPLPGRTQILAHRNRTAIAFTFIFAVAVVTNVQHQRAIGEFRHRTFRGIVAGGRRHLPGLAVVLAPGDVGKREALGVPALRGHHQGTVAQGDPVARRRRKQIP